MPGDVAIFLLLIGHWYLAAFCQTMFLHRYSSHQMFSMTRFWERFFYALTFAAQGSSYLNPRTYALMHRIHHAYSDTERDPHSPKYQKNPAAMMMSTLAVSLDIYSFKKVPDGAFQGGYPVWPAFDRWADGIPLRILWVAGYVLFYAYFATAWWQYLLLPVHIFMGPIHGAIVNWCGHMYGYANHENHDQSKNSFFADFFTMGELMQNNHHHDTRQPNFAHRWFEIDPTYPLLRLLSACRIIRLALPESRRSL